MKDKRTIEELYKSAFDRFEEEASSGFEKRFDRMMFWLQWRKLIILLVLILFAGIALWLLPGIINNSDKNLTETSSNSVLTDTSVPKKQAYKNYPPKEESALKQKKTDHMSSKKYDLIASTKSEIDNENISNSATNIINSDLASINQQKRDDNISITKQDNLIAQAKIELDNKNLSSSTTNIISSDLASTNQQKRGENISITKQNSLTVPLELKSNIRLKTPLVSPLETVNLAENSESSHRVQFVLSLFVTAAYNLPQLSTGSSNYQPYVDLRTHNEKPELSFNAGANIQIHYNRWYIETGLNYSVYKQKRNYDLIHSELDPTKSYFENDTTWGYIIDPPVIGEPVAIGIDSIWVPVYSDIHQISDGTNSWRYLEIPLLAGYTFSSNPSSKLTFDVSAGISAGFLLKSNGQFPSHQQPYSFSDFGDEPSNPVIFNAIIRLGMVYKINSNYGLFIRPEFKQNLSSVLKNDNPLKQKFSVYSITLGLNISLH